MRVEEVEYDARRVDPAWIGGRSCPRPLVAPAGDRPQLDVGAGGTAAPALDGQPPVGMLRRGRGMTAVAFGPLGHALGHGRVAEVIAEEIVAAVGGGVVGIAVHGN